MNKEIHAEGDTASLGEHEGPFGIQMRTSPTYSEPTYGPFVNDPETGRTAVFQTKQSALEKMYRWFRSPDNGSFRVAKLDRQ